MIAQALAKKGTQMETDKLNQLAKVHPAWTTALTAVAVVLVVAAGITRNWMLVTLVGVVVPLALVSAIQCTAVAPLAAEVLRLRKEIAPTPEDVA